jgi:hypothetical protein
MKRKRARTKLKVWRQDEITTTTFSFASSTSIIDYISIYDRLLYTWPFLQPLEVALTNVGYSSARCQAHFHSISSSFFPPFSFLIHSARLSFPPSYVAVVVTGSEAYRIRVYHQLLPCRMFKRMLSIGLGNTRSSIESSPIEMSHVAL